MTPTLLPPTDNLYKFMAIAGLLLLSASVYFPWQLSFKIKDENMQCFESLTVLEADVDYASAKQKEILEIVDNTILRQKRKLTNSPDIFEITYSMDEIKQMQNTMYELVHQNKVNLAKIKGNLLRNESLSHELDLSIVAQIILIAYSVHITRKGFRLWYERIQKHIDKELKESANARGRER